MSEICRLCGCEGKNFLSIFDKQSEGNINDSRYADDAMIFSRILIYKGDGLTDAICKECIAQLTICKNFRIQCEATDKRLRQSVSNKPDYAIKKENVPIEDDSSENNFDDNTGFESSHSSQIKSEDREILSERIGPEKIKDNPISENNIGYDSVDDKQKLQFSEEITTTGDSIKCSDCGKHCKSRKSWQKHLLKCQSKNKLSTLKTENEEILPKTLMCEQCGKQFKQRGSLLQHLHSHTGLKLFNCQLCHKDFSRSAHLMMHMRIHDKIKPVICEVCGRSFRKSSDLSRHKRIHSEARDFSCTVCGRSFKRSGDVISHMRSHTGDRPYKCKHCSKSYSSYSSLTKHLRSQDSCAQMKSDLKINPTLPMTEKIS